MKREIILHFGRGLLILGIDKKNISIHFIKPDAGKQPIKRGAAYDKRHPSYGAFMEGRFVSRVLAAATLPKAANDLPLARFGHRKRNGGSRLRQRHSHHTRVARALR